MGSDNQNKKCCAYDNEYGIYSEFFDRLCIGIYYNNHLKSGIHNEDMHKKQQLDNTNK